MNLPDLATTQNRLVPILPTPDSQGCFSTAFLCSCLLEDDPARFALIERDDPFFGRESIDSISVEAFAKTAKWNVPKDWRDRAKYLVEHNQIHRGIDDIKFLTLAKLEECLRVFTPEFDLESDQDTADFCRAVYPVVSSLKTEFLEGVSHEGRAFQDRDASTVGDWFYIWQDRNGDALFGSAMLRNRSRGYSGSEEAGMSALYHLRQWFSRLFVELHPAKREIERVCRIVDQGLCPMTEGDSVVYVFAKPVRRILLDAKRKLAPIREKDQPLLEDVAATEEVLKEVISKVSNPDVPHTANDLFPYRRARDFFDQLIRIFSSRTRPLALCPHFELPHFGTVAYDADTNISRPSFDNWKEQKSAGAAGVRPAAHVEPESESPKPDSTLAPNVKPVPPTLTIVELADFIQHFTNGAGEHNFPTRNDLDTFTEGVVGESVCYDGSGRGKCLAHYIREHQKTEPETVFRLCKALLELDLKRNPIKDDSGDPVPFDSLPDWQREANELRKSLLNTIRAAEARAVEQAKKNAEDKIRAAEEAERRERKYQEQLKAGTLPWWQVRPEDRDKFPKSPAPATPPAPSPATPPATPPAQPATPPAPPQSDPAVLKVLQSMDRNLRKMVPDVHKAAGAAISIDGKIPEPPPEPDETFDERDGTVWTKERLAKYGIDLHPAVSSYQYPENIVCHGKSYDIGRRADARWEVVFKLIHLKAEEWTNDLPDKWQNRFPEKDAPSAFEFWKECIERDTEQGRGYRLKP